MHSVTLCLYSLTSLSLVFFSGRRQECVENKILNPKSFPGELVVRVYRTEKVTQSNTAPSSHTAGPAEQLELVGELLKELSQGQAGERGPEERRGTLLELLKVAREDSPAVWEEHFKTMLLLLLETLGDKDVRTRAVHLVSRRCNVLSHLLV